MTEIKTWGDRLAEIPDGTITTSYHVTGAMQDEIDELRARLAQQAAMVEKCMVAMNENADRGMKAEQERDELFSAALAKSQSVEQGEPVRPMSDEEREDAFSRLPNAKSGQFYYYLGIADAEAFHGIKGVTE